MPAASRSSTMPAHSGASGPTTTKSILLVWQKAITAAWSARSSATHSRLAARCRHCRARNRACRRAGSRRSSRPAHARGRRNRGSGCSCKDAGLKGCSAIWCSMAARPLQEIRPRCLKPALNNVVEWTVSELSAALPTHRRGRLRLRAGARRDLRLQGRLALRPLLFPPQGRQGGARRRDLEGHFCAACGSSPRRGSTSSSPASSPPSPARRNTRSSSTRWSRPASAR